MTNPAETPLFSIVMPAYNEQAVISRTLQELAAELDSSVYSQYKDSSGRCRFEIVVTDDGSSDNTYDIVKKISDQDDRIRVFRHKKNLGFGSAVMNSIRESKGGKILLIPSDGQFDPSEIIGFLKALDEYDLVIGVRPGREGYGLFRKLVSFVYISLVKLLFGKTFRDTNWVQAWKTDVFKKITPRSSGVFFLQETITRTERAGFCIGEIPSRHIAREKGEASGGRLSVILFTLYEMLKFRFASG